MTLGEPSAMRTKEQRTSWSVEAKNMTIGDQGEGRGSQSW